MEHFLSKRVREMSLSATLTMAQRTRELISQGQDIINLSLGEPHLSIPIFIREEAKRAIDELHNKYTPIDGLLALKEAICQKFKKDNNLDYLPKNIVVSTGAKQSLANIALACLEKGNEVIIPTPCWVSYFEIVKLAEATPIIVKTSIENGFKLTAKALEDAITPRTKMLWICSPNNPSGSIYSREELEDLARVLQKYPNIFVVSDEIYEYINFMGSHHSMAQIEGMKERTIVVNGVSKAYAMMGWRIGYMAAPEFIAKACTKIQGQVTSGANCIAQMASVEAIKSLAIPDMVESFHKQRDIAYCELSSVEGFKMHKPDGAFYLFPDVSFFFGKEIKGRKISSATDFVFLLLEEAKVATVTGEAFGDANCIRISYATSEENLREGIRRIKEVLV